MAKNIVVLSDGTGNRAGKAEGTNVWRLYEAVDLRHTTVPQIVFYDDGVGSGDSTYSKVLGGAFGFGLKRNVIELYEALSHCFNEGDRIYMFGFSRGAYTIRVLVGLIHCCGLVPDAKGKTAEQLRGLAKANYRKFRSRFARLQNLSELTGRKRQVQPCRAVAGPDGTASLPNIAFLGLWDTVDAYGFPADELADFWNEVVYPYRFVDRDLSPLVAKARHALSLDDERKTFHPVLWNEAAGNDDRIQQVWFAGVHANVGGGYPDDSLSLVSLEWMMAEAELAGLKFIDSVYSQVEEQANIHGKLYDSRSGFGLYYRYAPRSVAAFCDDPENKVAARPRIHASALARARTGCTGYAPLGIPEDYDIVGTTARINQVAQHPAVSPGNNAGKARADALQVAWDFVFWRRRLYFLFLAVSLVLLLTPSLVDWERKGACTSTLCDFLTPLFAALGALVPDLVESWLEALRQNPGVLGLFALLFGVLYTWRNRLHAATNKAALEAWSSAPPSDRPGLTRRLRVLAVSPGTRKLVRRVWAAVGIVLAATILALGVVLADRLFFMARESSGTLCPVERTESFTTRNACYGTGHSVKTGTRYRIEVAVPERWQDGSIAAGPEGFTNPEDAKSFWMRVFLPFRRSWTEPWFKLMGRVGASGTSTFPIGMGMEFVADRDGELFLFVNDAVFGLWPGWDIAYRWESGKNTGSASITLTELGPAR